MDIDGDFRSELVGKEGQNARFVESLLCTPKIIEPTDYTILSLLYQKYNDPIRGNPLPFQDRSFWKILSSFNRIWLNQNLLHGDSKLLFEF